MRQASTLRRAQDWPERLAALIEDRRERPFVWGEHDCCTLAADAVKELTGVDPMAALRGTYGSEAEAEQLIITAGGLEALVAGLCAGAGMGACHPAFVQRGDVALVHDGNHLAVGVVIGETVMVPGPDKITVLPLRTIQRAWSV